MGRPMGEALCGWTNGWSTVWVDQWVEHCVGRPLGEALCGSTNGWSTVWVDQWVEHKNSLNLFVDCKLDNIMLCNQPIRVQSAVSTRNHQGDCFSLVQCL